MLLYIQSKSFFCYRVLFVALFLLMGIACLGVFSLQQLFDYNLVITGSETGNEALLATLCFMGVLGFLTASMMIYLMREKRQPASDRRQISKSVSFSERRTGANRRI